MEEIERIRRLVEHWMEHNNEHADNYRVWAERLKGEGKIEIGNLLSEVHKKTLEIGDLFKRIKEIL